MEKHEYIEGDTFGFLLQLHQQTDFDQEDREALFRTWQQIQEIETL